MLVQLYNIKAEAFEIPQLKSLHPVVNYQFNILKQTTNYQNNFVLKGMYGRKPASL